MEKCPRLQHSDHAGTRQLASRQPLPELGAGLYNDLMILVFKALIVCKKTGNVKDSKFRIAKGLLSRKILNINLGAAKSHSLHRYQKTLTGSRH
jgi:hypothetical protein